MNDYTNYILNDANMLTYLKYKITNLNDKYLNSTKTSNNNFLNKQNLKNNTSQSIFIPKEGDTLFWCYYIIKNGDIKYELLNNKNSLTAKQIKIDFINIIRQNKDVIKIYKFDTISNIESNLANDEKINIKTIMALCSIDKINLIYISKNTFFELLMDDNKPIYFIREIDTYNKYQNINKKFGFEIASNIMIEEIRNTFYKVETLGKPIKAISFYKLQDLINISNKLAIDIIDKETGKNKTKNDLYEAIIQYF